MAISEALKNSREYIRKWLFYKAIDKSQKKVEKLNFEIRMSLFKVDQILYGSKRESVYKMRQGLLEGKESQDVIWEMIEKLVTDILKESQSKCASNEWDTKAISIRLLNQFGLKVAPNELFLEKPKEQILLLLREKYRDREQKLGYENMKELERYLLLYAIDSMWKWYLREIDELKNRRFWSYYSDQNPMTVFQNTSDQLFSKMLAKVRKQVGNYIFCWQISKEEALSLLKSPSKTKE